MAEMKIGEFVKSKSGHDKGKIYIITNKTEKCVYISDGRLRKVSNPKKKSNKHVQPVNITDVNIKECLDKKIDFKDELIKKAIKDYELNSKQMED